MKDINKNISFIYTADLKSKIKLATTSFFSSLLLVGSVLLLPSEALATNHIQLTGLYSGDATVWGEQITFNFMEGGAMHIISDNEQPLKDFPFTEFSSQGTGIWQRTGPKTLDFSYIEHRRGNYLCGDGGRTPENCLLIGYGSLVINDDDTVSVNIGLKIRDRILDGVPRGDSFNKDIGPFDGLPVSKRSINDLLAE